jgi:hypothetical protein
MKAQKNWRQQHYDCLKHKSLRSVLLYKFLNEYGFQKGEVVAKVIVEDILKLVDRFYCSLDRLKPGKILWFVADKESYPGPGKTYKDTKMVPVVLTIVEEDDFLAVKEGKTFSQMRNHRIVKWFYEAYEQGGVMTHLDASMLAGFEESYTSKIVQDYQDKTGDIVPTRGNVHDIGPGVTHKAKVIELYLKRYLTPEIARITNHSRKAVDRYIRGFEIVRMLREKFDDEKIPVLAQMSRPLVRQYLELIPKKQKRLESQHI